MKIITRYLLKEFVAPFFLGLLCFTFILLLNEIFLLTKTFVQKGISPRYLVELIIYILPATLVLTIPMAVLVGLLLSFGNLSTQNEITAMKASGIGVHQLAMPILVVSFGISLIDLGLMNYVLPRANQAHFNLIYDIRAHHTAMTLEDGVIMRELEREGKTWIYEKRDPTTERLQHVRIFDEYRDGKPRFITAREADVIFADGYAHLKLYDGFTYDPHPTDPSRYTTFRFREKDISLDLSQTLERSERDIETPRNMSLGRLRKHLRGLRKQVQDQRKAYYELARKQGREDPEAYAESKLTYLKSQIVRSQVEWHKKFAIPFASLAFGLVGVPLGIAVRRSGRMVGMGLGLGLILVYYVFLQMGQTLGVRGHMAPWLAIWLSNIVTFVTGGLLILHFMYGHITSLFKR